MGVFLQDFFETMVWILEKRKKREKTIPFGIYFADEEKIDSSYM